MESVAYKNLMSIKSLSLFYLSYTTRYKPLYYKGLYLVVYIILMPYHLVSIYDEHI